MPAVLTDFKALSIKYPAWFKKFKQNLTDYFKTITLDGVLWVTEQRPSLAYEGMNIDQFKQSVLAVFSELLIKIGRQ